MRILVIGTNYSPERTAVAPFTTGLCEHLAAQGHKVTVVTTFPYYPEWRIWPEYRGLVSRKELMNGVTVRRVWHYVPRRPSSLLQRLAHDASFSLASFVAGLFVGKCELIYCTCPPPMVGLAAYLLRWIKRAPYVIKLTDLASDAALATGIINNRFVMRIARAIESFVYGHARSVVCLCQGFVDKLTDRGVPPENLYLIPDWGDTQNIFPMEKDEVFARTVEIPPDQFLVLHTGNMGKKQDLRNVVQAAELTKAQRGVLWLLVGQGEERSLLEQEISARQLTNIRMLPLQPAKLLPHMYSAAGLLLLNQKAALEDANIPSKLLAYMAAGRPVLAAINERSEAARQIRRARCGVLVPAESPTALAEAVLALWRDPSRRRRLGAKGRAYAEEHFTKTRVLKQYDEFLRVVKLADALDHGQASG